MQCDLSRCNNYAVLHEFHVADRRCAAEFNWCSEHWRKVESLPTPVGSTARDDRGTPDGFRQCDVSFVLMCAQSLEQLLVLREFDGRGQLLLKLGSIEANAIVTLAKQTVFKRPLTHAAMASAIGALGGTVQDVLIHHRQRISIMPSCAYCRTALLSALICDGAMRLRSPLKRVRPYTWGGIVSTLRLMHRQDSPTTFCGIAFGGGRGSSALFSSLRLCASAVNPGLSNCEDSTHSGYSDDLNSLPGVALR